MRFQSVSRAWMREGLFSRGIAAAMRVQPNSSHSFRMTYG
jgi:hypothetical protein